VDHAWHSESAVPGLALTLSLKFPIFQGKRGKAMKDRLERKTGQSLLDELIRQLKSRERIGDMLGDLATGDAGALAEQLVDELERIIGRRHIQHQLIAANSAASPASESGLEARPSVPVEAPGDSSATPATAPVVPAAKADKAPSPPSATRVGVPAVPPLKKEEVPVPPPDERVEVPEAPATKRHEAPAPPPPKPITAANAPTVKAEEVPGPLPVKSATAPPEQVTIKETEPKGSDLEDLTSDHSPGSTQKQVPRVPSEIGDEDYIYLHGVSRIEPEETPSAYPFLLEEKGMDNRSFAFAYDLKGLRFYGSVLGHESVNLAKNGVLLLSKQEKIRMRGAHESILNDLRLHRIILPFEFGTVVNGPAELRSRLEERFAEILDALNDLLATRWWNVTVYALDSRAAEIVGQPTLEARRQNDRGRVPYSSPTQAKRIDVKTLERILNKQKKAAESIHEALTPYAERSDIDLMVTLQSGSSDDWKVILKASYELGPSMLNQFMRKVTDLQYQHFLMELMISLTGNVESFSFARS
jgi:hypothetical protein